MADAPSEAALAAPLENACRALERGDYGQVLRLLEPLASQHPPATSTGAGVRLLMATALMGQGQTDQAASCCRSLNRCPDPQLRAQLENTRARILQILQLDKENEQLLLRCSLAANRPADTAAPTASVSMLQKIYARCS
jgi:hypothetical protein